MIESANVELDKVLNEVDLMSGFEIVKENQRMKFLPSITPRYFLRLEAMYFNILSKCVPSYGGGHHEFLVFPNGAKTMAFDLLNDAKVEVHPFGYPANIYMTNRAVSVAAFAIALNHLGNSLYSQGDEEAARGLFTHFEMLHDVLLGHEMFADEQSAIFRFMD